jgi:hypothetical protein
MIRQQLALVAMTIALSVIRRAHLTLLTQLRRSVVMPTLKCGIRAPDRIECFRARELRVVSIAHFNFRP